MEENRETIYKYLSEIPDPEIPVVNIVELGIVRKVVVSDTGIIIELTPTYSGCPAMHMIENQIVSLLHLKGFYNVEIKKVYSPAWSSDLLSEESKGKLKKYGIAPPERTEILDYEYGHIVQCPYCNSENTILKSWFGSTACKSTYYCNSCKQPFEKFKSI